MLAEVKILVEGFTNANELDAVGEEQTQPTVTLVRDGNIVMVVDPGILDSQQVLIDALKKENLTVHEVNVVCVTHSHLDHYRNIGMFPKAKTLEYYGLWNKNTIETWSENFTPNIKVLHTPGHDYTGITLLVKTRPESGYPGVVAICGDVFWKKNYPADPHDDAFASNSERLRESREMILEAADWIIPGHGPMYKNIKGEVVAEEEIQAPVMGPRITVICKRCGMPMAQKDKCKCRPYLCFRCCECGLDCDNCSCSHKK